MADADALIIEDYDKGVVDAPEEIVAAAKKAGMTVVVDPKFKDLTRYVGADIIKPNRSEFEHAVGVWRDEDDLARRGTELLDRVDVGALVITLGGDGLAVIQRDGAIHRVQAGNVEIYDVTGAGDTVAAGLGVAASLGWSVVEGAHMANLAAGLVCERIGTAAASAEEINRTIARQPTVEHGVIERNALIAAVATARARGDKIVFTNGCFDILHAGHVGYLAQARGLGDRLVVAVNDDASAARLKGDGRPVNDLVSRMRVLDGLASVDWVTSFSEDTPEALLAALRPDVIAKGGRLRRERSRRRRLRPGLRRFRQGPGSLRGLLDNLHHRSNQVGLKVPAPGRNANSGGMGEVIFVSTPEGRRDPGACWPSAWP